MTPQDRPDDKQQVLDSELVARPTVPFISDWNGTHPLAKTYLGDPRSYAPTIEESARYWWAVDDRRLIEQIMHIHRRDDRRDVVREQIVPGPGSTTFIAAYITWLASKGVREIFYIPPIYYTFHSFAKLFGISLRPVAERHDCEPRFSMQLPPNRTHLVLTDPVWYAGCAMSEETIAEVARWQKRTGSEVFVDGSFQYLRWDGKRVEPTSALAPDRTFRLICPTKAVGIPAYRFSYLIMPPEQWEAFRWMFETATGSNSFGDLAFGRRSVEILAQPESNLAFSSYLGETFRSLREDRLIETTMEPDCGYFVFVKLLRKPRRHFRSMDQTYFEQTRYDGYVRINLMLADLLRDLLA